MPKKRKPDNNLIWIIVLLIVVVALLFYLQQKSQQENFLGESYYGRWCRDECPYVGARTCDGRLGVKYCGHYDYDKCLEWSRTKYCSQGQICLGQEPTARCGPIPTSAYT